MRRTPRRGSVHRIWLAAVAAAVLAAVLAAPAAAAPAPTTWQLSPASKTLTYGQAVTLNGILMSGDAAVGGLWVDFAQATTQAGPYEVVYKVTTPSAAYATGTYSVVVMPLQTMYYRFSWPGDANYAASNSNAIPVQVKPSLGRPSCPSRAKKGKRFTVKGTVKPGQGTAPAVKIRAYKRNSSGAYVSYRTYSAKVSGTRYSVSIKLGRTGKYQFKATTGATAEFAAATSRFSRVLTVKK